MSDGSDADPQVQVESADGRTQIEVIGDTADEVTKNLLNALSPTVGSAQRIYVEVDETVPDSAPAFSADMEPDIDPAAENPFAVTSPDEPTESPADDDGASPDDAQAASSIAEDVTEISEGTAMHAVASALRRNGPMTSSDIKSRVDGFAEGTISSNLSKGKAGLVFAQDSVNGASRWKLTDWGHEQATALGEYAEVEDDG